MPWDVFISHASEDKQAVAVPLKQALEAAGVSVWMDMDQIVAGQGLRRRIDHGLANCRFTVVVTSPSFFSKEWTQKELDAVVNQEAVGRQHRVIPVLYGMSFADLQKHSPLLAGSLALPWSDGLTAVVAKVKAIVSGTTVPVAAIPPVGPPPGTPAAELDSLVLLMAEDGRSVAVRSRDLKVAGAESLEVWLRPEHPDAHEFLMELAKGRRHLLNLAYGLRAVRGRVQAAEQAWDKGREEWRLTLRLEDAGGGGFLSEVSVNGVSADEIAMMRARRILLDERLPGNMRFGMDTMEGFVAGMSGPLRAGGSPFPQVLSGKPLDAETLAVARLYAVLLLRLSHTVEHVHRLDLTPAGAGRLQVAFRGRRARQSAQREPTVIEVDGVCPLDLRK